MPFFSPKTWKQRIVEFPGRRRLDDTSSADVYDVSRAEGTVTQEGDGFTAANMNDLEQRINNAVNDVAGLSADEYDPNATYSSGDLRIHDNILHKAKQDISVAETWTPDHWELTTLAAELSAVNSSIVVNEFLKTQDILESVQSYVTFNEEMIPDGYSVITAWCTSEHPSSVLCGSPYVEKNRAIAPYIANQPEQGEKFHLYIALKRS